MRWPPQRRVAASAPTLRDTPLRAADAAGHSPGGAPASRSSYRWPQGAAAPSTAGDRLGEAARRGAARTRSTTISVVGAIATPLLAYGVFAALALIYSAPEWRWGIIAHQDDTRLFYYPVMAALAAALRQGSLSLWAPGLFGGYPLFADGGVGVLYPPHFLLLRSTSPEQALVWLRVLHLFLAGAFTFHYVRQLGLGTFGGLVAGLTFAYSGFFAAQVVHTNLSEACVWLPLALYAVERARRANASAWAALAGVAVGIQGLAVHVNISLMTGLFVALYALVVFALLPGDGAATPRRRAWQLVARGARGAAVVAIVGAVAFGIAAVQLLPLYELGHESFRSQGLSSSFAAVNSVAPVNLATLILPNLFGGTLERPGWGLWIPWETAIYVGLLPLLLALLALFARPRFYMLLYALVAVLALLVAFGDLGPWPLWERLRLVPMFNALQSPGRFGLFFTLAVAVLAAHGATDLVGRTKRSAARGSSLALVGCGLAVGALVFALQLAGPWVAARRDVLERGLAHFLDNPGAPRLADGTPVSPSAAYDRLVAALAPNGPQVDGQVRVLVAGLVLLVGWHAASRLAATRTVPAGWRTAIRWVGQAALLLVIGVDLLGFGQSYHPRAPFASLRPELPPPLAQAPPPGEGRIFTRPDPTRRFAAAPNALLPTGWEEVTGFTSLESDRHARYVAQVEHTDNHLLDLLNARYVLDRGKLPDLPVYGGVPYYPERPLISGTAANPGAHTALRVDRVSSHEVGIISWLVGAADAPQGAEIGQLVVTDATGATFTVPLRAGQHTADRVLAALPAGRTAAHQAPAVAEALSMAADDGTAYLQQRYYGRVELPRTADIVRIEIQYTWPRGVLEVFGLAPLRPDGAVEPLPPKERYRWLYGDSQWLVAENTTVLPRAFLVSSVQVARQDQDVLARMADGPFDPRRLALVERGGEQEAPWPGWQLLQDTNAGEARLELYRPQEIVVRTVSATDGFLVLLDPFFPGWRAAVDGLGTEIYRTDYLFRGVFVPAGEHVVRFAYEPVPFRLGAGLTLLTILTLLGALSIALGRRLVSRRE